MKELHIYGTGRKCGNLGKIEEESIGLNCFPLYYPQVKYWLWIDNKAFDFCIYEKTINEIKAIFPFKPGKDICGAYSVATFAITWAIKQKYDKVYLYGILDDEYEKAPNEMLKWYHFYDTFYKLYPIGSFDLLTRYIDELSDFIDIEFPLKYERIIL